MTSARDRFPRGEFIDERVYENDGADAPESGPSPAHGFELVGVDRIFAPLPPVPYLVRRLDMCPGAPTLFAGYGFSGKTVAAQSLALSVCTGRDLWGDFAVQRSGRVVHFDFEQGFRLTADRYQRLARARGFTPEQLAGLLHLVALPSITLSDAVAREALLRACDGCALAIVDSFRASAPEVDENSSDARRTLDLLASVSDKTGCVPLLIHHSRKPRDESDGGAKVAIRGSSAIFDACASVFVFSAKKGEPTTVQHEKARTSGILEPDFTLAVRDVEIGGHARAGLEVCSVAQAPRSVRAASAQRNRFEVVDASVLAFIRRNPGASRNQIESTEDVVAGTNARRQAIERLMMGGAVVERSDGTRRGTRALWPVAAERPGA